MRRDEHQRALGLVVTAALFVAGSLAQLVGLLVGAGELLGSHKRARNLLANTAKTDATPSDDLVTLRGALAAAELNRRNVVVALVLLSVGIACTLAANLAAR